MLLKVNPHKIEIVKSPVNEREINISKCTFEFADEITNDYVKEAYFTFGGTTYKQIIVNDECDFPSEVLTKKGTVEIGVVAYLVENETEIKRYNPSPAYFNTWDGSLKDNAENSEPITPSEMEQFEQALNDGLNEVANVDIDATKEEDKTVITITNRHAEEKTVEILDGAKGEKGDKGDKGEQGEQGVQGIQGVKGDTGEPFTIKKTYSSVAEMNADFYNMQYGDYVMIASSVEVEDNAKLYTRGQNQWIYITDFSGATGIKGEKGDKGEQGVQGIQGIQGIQGETGEKGDTGNGILSIQKTAISGLVDTYTITFTDGTTTTFDVTNGEDGEVTQTQLDETNNNVSWLQTLTEQMPRVSEQGTDLSLENVLNYRLMKFLPQGVSSQDGEPTPTTPISVKSVTGENSLAISSGNLFSATWEQGTINSTTGANSGSNVQIRTKNYIYVTPNQNYTFKRSIVGGYINLRCYDNNKNYLESGTNYSNIIRGNTTTQPMENNDSECELSFKDDVRYIRIIDSSNNLSTEYTMVKGSTAPSTYVEHEEQNYQISLGNIELNSSPDGTIRDQIVGKPNEWYKREYIGKVVLDGVNNAFATKSNTNANKVYFTDEINNMVVPSSNNNLGKGLSSHFKLNTAQNVYANDLIGFGIRVDNKINYGFGASSDLTTLALANQWLQEQYNNGTPVTTYYLHVNYVDIPITDTTLISQLNDIYNNAHSYNGVTNITTTYEDGNEQMYLDIEALKNVWDTSL